MPEAELERMPATTDTALEPLATLLAADVVAVHLDPEDGAPALEISILDRPAAEEMRSQCVDLRTFLRERLTPLASDERLEAMALLDEVAAAEPAPEDQVGLSASRALVREALRDPLPPSLLDRDEPQGMHFDSVLALAEDAFYVRGWARDGQAPLQRLTVVSPEGSRVELLPGIYREPRPDVHSFFEEPTRTGAEGTGFLGYCETRSPSLLSTGWILEMENALGVAREFPGPQVTRDLLGARTSILNDLHKESGWETPLMDHVVPAVSRIQQRLEERAAIEEVWEFGEPAANPEASIVVPLYGRIDFLEHQLAQFVHDPELRESDLIYVLDSPELATALKASAGQLFELYGVPFRVVVLAQNGGYSVANNRGASLARGRRLLLLNSDVLPAVPGWLGRMSAFYEDQDSIGALGPKLLFEDDTLQHAGIKFQRPPGGGAWENEHYFKGLHRDLPAANMTRRVPAVSGACLMIDRELFEDLDGLRGMYVQGDYEDTDLCLRLRERGRETWYLPEVELYHLEGQSYALETRTAMSRYNVWLHTRLWDSEIEAAMAETA
ncbi:MAG TPA: glycosyltransferase [Solirubrobacterales bacterium]|jgi:GT2 family glycosyltransferase|nr:glycosyltransferase [Solirubrobacterales bacterium]